MKGDYCDKPPSGIGGFCSKHKAALRESLRSTPGSFLDLCPSRDQLQRATELDVVQKEQVRDAMLARRIEKWWLSCLHHYMVRNVCLFHKDEENSG